MTQNNKYDDPHTTSRRDLLMYCKLLGLSHKATVAIMRHDLMGRDHLARLYKHTGGVGVAARLDKFLGDWDGRPE